jgi:hypothetical protein
VHGTLEGQEEKMNLTENQEPFIIFPALIIAILLLVLIDRIGTIRTPRDEEEEEI